MILYGGMSSKHELVNDLSIFDFENQVFLNVSLEHGTWLCDSVNLVPAFYEAWTQLTPEELDWGNAKDFILKEGFYIFGGWLAKN